MVRRIGCKPERPRLRSASATSSAQAPAALTRIAGANRPGGGLDVPAVARSLGRAQRGVGSHRRRRRGESRRRQAAWKAATSMSAQLGSNQAPVHCSRSPGIIRSSSARSRWTSACSPVSSSAPSIRSPCGPVRWTAPRRRSNGVADPGQPASNIGLDAKLSRRAGPRQGSPPRRRPSARSNGSRTDPRPRSGSRAPSPASRAPRLAPAIPPPTIRTSQSLRSYACHRALVTIWKAAPSSGAAHDQRRIYRIAAWTCWRSCCWSRRSSTCAPSPFPTPQSRRGAARAALLAGRSRCPCGPTPRSRSAVGAGVFAVARRRLLRRHDGRRRRQAGGRAGAVVFARVDAQIPGADVDRRRRR